MDQGRNSNRKSTMLNTYSNKKSIKEAENDQFDKNSSFKRVSEKNG